MKTWLLIFTLLVSSNAGVTPKKASEILWTATECNKPLMLPDNGSCVSKFGKGQYRVDFFGNPVQSHEHFNCIYLSFQPSGELSPATITGSVESSFTLNGQKVIWRTYPTTVEGHSVVRKEALMPNSLPRVGQDKDSAYIWVRMDGDSNSVVEQLTPIAEGIVQDAQIP